jgi:hypothetical protein
MKSKFYLLVGSFLVVGSVVGFLVMGRSHIKAFGEALFDLGRIIVLRRTRRERKKMRKN